jgi:hypothetical protein
MTGPAVSGTRLSNAQILALFDTPSKPASAQAASTPSSMSAPDAAPRKAMRARENNCASKMHAHFHAAAAARAQEQLVELDTEPAAAAAAEAEGKDALLVDLDQLPKAAVGGTMPPLVDLTVQPVAAGEGKDALLVDLDQLPKAAVGGTMPPLVDLSTHADAPATALPAASQREAGELLQQLDNHKEEAAPAQRALVDKTASFLAALPEPVQALIAQRGAQPAADSAPAHQAPSQAAQHTGRTQHTQQSQHTQATRHAAAPSPALPGLIGQQLHALEALEKEHAELLASQGDKHSPAAALRAKEIETRMSMLMNDMLSLMKMLADINKRANEIANGAI